MFELFSFFRRGCGQIGHRMAIKYVLYKQSHTEVSSQMFKGFDIPLVPRVLIQILEIVYYDIES